MDDYGLVVNAGKSFSVNYKDIRAVDMLRLHGLGRVLKIVHAGGTAYLSVVRFNILGYFAVINYFRTGQLYEQLKKRSANT